MAPLVRGWPFHGLEPGAYGVILADPPWRFETRSERGRGKCPDRHYPVMKLEELKRLPVAQLAAPDCLLVLWFPMAHVGQVVPVTKVWGFTPKTLGCWAKQSATGESWAFGTGYIFRGACEFYLAATRGHPRRAVRDVRNLIIAPVREHSRKPDQLHRDLERMFPNVRRCELFARRHVPGWDCWGNELDQQQEIAA
jgi:N6-adenosine-specific RNA methylase IME4